MNVNVINLSGDLHSQLNISDIVFNRPCNRSLVHQVVTSYMSSCRQGSKAQKNRSEVSGSGVKPWRQKGTGRARAGSIRSPIFRKGGVTFAAKPRSYRKKINKKMYKIALSSILSELIRKNRLFFFKDLNNFNSLKTKDFVLRIMRPLGIDDALIVVDIAEILDKMYLSSRNVKNVALCDSHAINPLSLICFSKVCMSVKALKVVEERLL